MSRAVEAAGVKTCKRCGVEKALSEFYKSARGYYQSQCKPCNRAHVREYAQANRGRITHRLRGYQAAWRERNKGTAKYRSRQILENMALRSAKRGWPRPEFTADEVLGIIQDGACSQTGVPYDFQILSGRQNSWTPVPDRIDSTLPYTKENVQWVCNLYNAAKMSWSDADVLTMATALIAHKREGNV